MRLFNKIPVLDKGFVAGLAFHLEDKDLDYIWAEHLAGSFPAKLLDLPQATLLIKCPLFVQLWLGEGGLATLSSKRQDSPEAYIPDVAAVAAPNLEVSMEIAKDLEQTTHALLINPRAYRHDGCDPFVAQAIMPISVYNQAIVSGSLRCWIDLVSAEKLPKPIEAYRQAISEVLLTEWKKLPEYSEQALKWQEGRRRLQQNSTPCGSPPSHITVHDEA